MQNEDEDGIIRSPIPSINTPSLHDSLQSNPINQREMPAIKTMTSRSSKSSGRSRWCPTPEQVMLLEGMYRGGLTTPTSTQIQQITARLSLYGKIQGKSVFYWFQNHKARDRQKIQKKLLAMHQNQLLYSSYYHPFHLKGGVGVVEDKLSCRNIINQGNVYQNSKKVMCDCSLMTSMTMESTSPYCIGVPPETLQLFPTAPLNPSEPN
ncbi:hypothetical protein L1987_13601 [Smallanthus sonchifolius]|uniref:Uncharacterized protein n=1 Tax=Smallanthus sonchifolius TaxID=185202 RepID=A0ACB9JJB7_9ASTR|nr:hypothetical protein L1987_13601 [Smallanthus sonchifolius]